jgi:hypothetical protein
MLFSAGRGGLHATANRDAAGLGGKEEDAEAEATGGAGGAVGDGWELGENDCGLNAPASSWHYAKSGVESRPLLPGR